MTNKNDQLYITKIINGDVNAFAHLVDNYKNMVFSLAFKMTKSREEAEEISQDTFIKAFKNLENFKGDSKFSTWLYRIAYHTSLDAIKKNRNNNATFEINEITFNQIQAVETILQGIERKERSKIMDVCLQKLPDEQRTIIWMFYYDELSLKEIMEVTSLSEANLKVKLHRARKKLLTIVKENVEPEIIENYGRK
ncbi:sigma-70 family RNA polymerase sigma factor [Polaribacter vadi]|uniref:RNA polymerase sigma factor n=1 Tax=Polaribacter TaxID=52959 RepID=UPI001C0A17F8|nr:MULTISPECIES: sigma-70 family RNA polymerase sigma factor [Polaribacter]MBU3012946.1 sigma-70 family RNA polymerase sigma factor [Polaribacter vadi]MDO6742764.1 sigma-70 family RNA polymerase sigma factor [Polaribacter sp. 1_MG-2023]